MTDDHGYLIPDGFARLIEDYRNRHILPRIVWARHNGDLYPTVALAPSSWATEHLFDAARTWCADWIIRNSKHARNAGIA